jgi:hypothetical protein
MNLVITNQHLNTASLVAKDSGSNPFTGLRKLRRFRGEKTKTKKSIVRHSKFPS